MIKGVHKRGKCVPGSDFPEGHGEQAGCGCVPSSVGSRSPQGGKGKSGEEGKVRLGRGPVTGVHPNRQRRDSGCPWTAARVTMTSPRSIAAPTRGHNGLPKGQVQN